MTTEIYLSGDRESTNAYPSIKASLPTIKFRNRIWSFGILCLLFNIINQSLEFSVDGSLSAIELVHSLTASLLLTSWILLKPEASLESERLHAKDINTLKFYTLSSLTPPHETYLHKTGIRMLQLEKYHLISQEYLLPIPYLCQIYHLLNLKHLESTHCFSLNGLKIVDVSQFETTASGGAIKFQTVLESPLNLLRMWRQPVVEVELILHTPYTVELSIPIYGNKNITVIFNILPMSNNDHKLFIDIYSNIIFPRLLLQIILHLASSLTLLEDLPYLRKLAKGKIHCSGKADKGTHHTMQLFERFAELYGSSLEQPQSSGATELLPIQAIGATS